MAGHRRQLKTQVTLYGFLLATLAISIAIVVTSRPPLPTPETYEDFDRSAFTIVKPDPNDVVTHRRQLSSMREFVYQFRDPKSVADKTPRFWKYAYVIVNYHQKSEEHALSDLIVKHINSNLNQFGRPLKRIDIDSIEHFNDRTKCSELSFAPGTITVIRAPQLHCSTEQLRDILLSHPDPKQPKWGIKIIHLVRNPFTMAVSNYYLQGSLLESNTNQKNPCNEVWVGKHKLKDLAAKRLSQPKVKIRVRGQVPRMQPIMKRQDFKSIEEDCSALYQTKPGLENATLHEHLKTLDSTEGLRLATVDKMNDIALMTVNLIMFKRVYDLVKASNPNHITGDVEVKTIPMDDFIHQPASAMYQVYDFVFKDLLLEEIKLNRSNTYEQSYLKQRESNHLMNNQITYGKFEDKVELIEFLRKEPLLGPLLTKIEALLDQILFEESVRMERVRPRPSFSNI